MTVVSDLDDLAERVIGAPLGPPATIAQLRERNRRRRRREIGQRLVLVPVLMLIAGLVGIGLLTQNQPRVETSLALDGPTLTDTVFGAGFAADDAIWPEEPMELEVLLDRLATEVLRWPETVWDRSSLGPDEGGITATDPASPDRRVDLQLRRQGDGWQIISFYPPPRIQLVEGELASFGGVEFPDDTQTIEIYQSQGDGQTRGVQTYRPPTPDARSSVTLGTPVPAADAGAFLIVGRDASDRATLVTGIQVGQPAQLTVAIDALVAAAQPAAAGALHPELDASGHREEFDLDDARAIADIWPDTDLYIIPSKDRSVVCFYEAAPRNVFGGGCSDALTFNVTGYLSYSYDQVPEDGYTLVITPDDLALDVPPNLGTTVHPSGHLAVLPGHHIDNLVLDGDTLRYNG